jgi:hypothetical protein
MQPAAMDRKLGCFVPGPEASFAGPKPLTKKIQVAQFARTDGDIIEFRQQAERLEDACGMRQEIDSYPQLFDVCGGLEDGAGNACLMQRQC